MALASEQRLSAEESRTISTTVREEIARRRISRQRLADEARISISTLEKALSGRRPFTLATTIRLEEALGLVLRPKPPGAEKNGSLVQGALAPDELGNYSRPGVSWIEGSYLTIRPSFGEKNALYAYRTEITWDEAASRLAFREAERLDADFTQWGTVSVPNQSGYIYLVTNRHGQYRLIIVSRPTITGEMHGILTTLQAGRGVQLTPVSSPIVFVPIKKAGHVQFGRVQPKSPAYAKYHALLKRTLDEPFALFLEL